MSAERPLISVIIPVLNEIENVEALSLRMAQIVEVNDDYRFEFIIVDDGSSDGTGDAVLEHVSPAVHVRLVTLSRNFGPHHAVTAGLDLCHGDCAILAGADLQEPLELTREFADRWREGFDVVW